MRDRVRKRKEVVRERYARQTERERIRLRKRARQTTQGTHA